MQFASPPYSQPGSVGSLQLGGELLPHATGNFFGEKLGRFPRIMRAPTRLRDTDANHGRRSRTRNAYPVAAVPELGTKYPPQVGVCDGYFARLSCTHTQRGQLLLHPLR